MKSHEISIVFAQFSDVFCKSDVFVQLYILSILYYHFKNLVPQKNQVVNQVRKRLPRNFLNLLQLVAKPNTWKRDLDMSWKWPVQWAQRAEPAVLCPATWPWVTTCQCQTSNCHQPLQKERIDPIGWTIQNSWEMVRVLWLTSYLHLKGTLKYYGFSPKAHEESCLHAGRTSMVLNGWSHSRFSSIFP